MTPNSRTFLSALLACMLLVGPFVRAQGTFRIEVHPIVSLDEDAAQALQGKFEGPSRTVAGELRLPFTEEVRVPAVVFLHGNAGALSNQPVWIDKFIASGIAVFTVDLQDAVCEVDPLAGACPSQAQRCRRRACRPQLADRSALPAVVASRP